MKLHDIATITSGYAFRGAITPDKDGNILVFQAKDLIRGVPVIDTESLTRVPFDMPGYAGHLKTNDVLLIARGMKAGAFRATVFMSEAKNVIASSSVHIIRVSSPEINPEYLSYYLNSRAGQIALAGIVTGSYIGALPRRELEKIEIPIPVLEKQKTIINLYKNIEKQQGITEHRSELKKQIINATFSNLIKHYD